MLPLLDTLCQAEVFTRADARKTSPVTTCHPTGPAVALGPSCKWPPGTVMHATVQVGGGVRGAQQRVPPGRGFGM